MRTANTGKQPVTYNSVSGIICNLTNLQIKEQ